MSKYITIIAVVLLSALCVVVCSNQSVSASEQLFRMHIRANSNLEADQNVKMEIKEEFVNFLTPLVEKCESKLDVMRMVQNNKEKLESIADGILEKRGFEYRSNVKVCNEFFPERYYGDFQVKQGYYDALICELGEAKGNNWWCVVYPPLCFVDYDQTNSVVYKSKLWEIINKFFGREIQ